MVVSLTTLFPNVYIFCLKMFLFNERTSDFIFDEFTMLSYGYDKQNR